MNPYGRHTFVNWCRKQALAESWALRHLYRAHGFLPRCAPTRFEP